MCDRHDPCTNVCAHADKDAKPCVEKELERRDTTTMSLSFTLK